MYDWVKCPTMIIVAHPDDEVIGAGAQLPACREVQFTYVTDGAPRNMHDAHVGGFSRREDYAHARNAELDAALAFAGLAWAPRSNLAFVDQEASFHLSEVTRTLASAFEQLRPRVILTHPYEGGHPDHDAVAFGVHAARALFQKQHGCAPELWELTSYHNCGGKMLTGEFLPCVGRSVRTVPLTRQQRELKQKLFEFFITQKAVLASFGVSHERFRLAPGYDFTLPPHDGKLYYEMFNWGLDGREWRSLANRALEDLGLAA